MAYGLDRALGYYFDVYPGPDHSEEPAEQHNRFTGMTGAKITNEIGRSGVKVPDKHRYVAAGGRPVLTCAPASPE